MLGNAIIYYQKYSSLSLKDIFSLGMTKNPYRFSQVNMVEHTVFLYFVFALISREFLYIVLLFSCNIGGFVLKKNYVIIKTNTSLIARA